MAPTEDTTAANLQMLTALVWTLAARHHMVQVRQIMEAEELPLMARLLTDQLHTVVMVTTRAMGLSRINHGVKYVSVNV